MIHKKTLKSVGDALIVNCQASGSLGVQILVRGVGPTVVFEGLQDKGDTPFAINGKDFSNASHGTDTAGGHYIFNPQGLAFIQLRLSAITSGSVEVTAVECKANYS